MNFGVGVLAAAVLLTVPGALVGRAGGLRWLPAFAVGPALTYGIVGSAIVPLDALGMRWNAVSAVGALVFVAAVVAAGRVLLTRPAAPAESARAPATSWVDRPALTAAALQRAVLQRPAAAVRGGDPAVDADGRTRVVLRGGAADGRPHTVDSGHAAAESVDRCHLSLLVAVCAGLAWHYFPRHRFLMGEKYDSDGSAWMYAVAGLRPLWTHYDYPVQQGPGRNRFLFWAYADDAERDPRIAESVRALNIRYVLISSPVVGGFVMPDGLVSLDKSTSWAKIYDNGGARIYEWRGSAGTRKGA